MGSLTKKVSKKKKISFKLEVKRVVPNLIDVKDAIPQEGRIFEIKFPRPIFGDK